MHFSHTRLEHTCLHHVEREGERERERERERKGEREGGGGGGGGGERERPGEKHKREQNLEIVIGMMLAGAWGTKGNREVPRSADYEYEYVWVSRILTNDVLFRDGHTDKTNTNTNTTPSTGETCSTEATQPYSTCVQAHSRSLRIHSTAEFAPFFHSRKVNS